MYGSHFCGAIMYVLLQRRLDSQLAHVRSVRLHVTCTCDFYEQEFCSRMSCGLRYLHGYKNCVSVPVLKSGDTCKHIYTAPSFPVLSVEIRKMSSYCLTRALLSRMDLFVTWRTYPAELYVETSSSNGCYMDISDTEISVDISGLNSVGDKTFVIWNSYIHDSNGESGSEADEETCATHAVIFKCIGCTKQVQFQEKLAQIAILLNSDKHVPCRLELEPYNPIDSKAIAF